MSRVIRIVSGLFCFSVLHFACGGVLAAEPFDGLQAGADAHSRGEAARRGAVRQQVARNEDMRYRAGLPSAIDGTYRFEHAPNLESWYAYGPRARRRVFAPWHYVPGDIWGYRSSVGAGLRQPIDQRQVQTGAQRWESFPTYAPNDLRKPKKTAREEEALEPPPLELPPLEPPPLEPPAKKRGTSRSL